MKNLGHDKTKIYPKNQYIFNSLVFKNTKPRPMKMDSIVFFV